MTDCLLEHEKNINTLAKSDFTTNRLSNNFATHDFMQIANLIAK